MENSNLQLKPEFKYKPATLKQSKTLITNYQTS